MSVLTFAEKIAKAENFLPINGTDFIEFYVGNAKQAAHFYKTAFGFQSLAYAGPETGVKDRASYVLQQGKIKLVLTSGLKSESPICEHQKKHGDGVKILALWVDDAYKAFEETTQRGGKPYMLPKTISDEYGEVKMSGIYTYGETVHLFVERKNYQGPFMPGYIAWDSDYQPEDVGLLYVDHCVGNVGWDRMLPVVKWYENVMGFVNILSFDDKQINTEYSALMSKVMSNGNGYAKFPINEPAEGKKKSQVEEYLDYYEEEGVQHIAVATKNIVHTVTELKRRGVEFLSPPPEAYYEMVPERVGAIEEDLSQLKKLGILIDRDEEGYLLQIFTKPVEDRPTLFFEIIERHGAQSFGAGNFKALFEALEKEQARRGNL
ncbi:4-hydroxyphenylpyruvate dioxygenase [Elizabethkingia sp. JS20170427COW]|uniref:4-hydroxyphenylpyruvate dioxygenase n=1 Tax=Elizabethkingia sp. JS20170427COW TaxID=2583851 RepID=UPI0011101CD0|nr:4-hydroxyphenylpyruvate dioxygenase [Elizabethkingia sp. JS20170427COW]QCX54230.1 4-hydroxyphenylpyruvate dioxygenase [Elizabethkingia sp. JS20170427COW]